MAVLTCRATCTHRDCIGYYHCRRLADWSVSSVNYEDTVSHYCLGCATWRSDFVIRGAQLFGSSPRPMFVKIYETIGEVSGCSIPVE